MKKLTAIILLACVLCTLAYADVWKWVDANGDTHYVDTMTPIYTWLGDDNKVHYSDKPDHPDAVAVQLVWHSKGKLENFQQSSDSSDGGSRGDDVDPNETEADRQERERAEAYYCKRATEIYDSYVNAPQLYKTNDAGEKEYLTEQDAEATIAQTKAKVDELCN
jgi:hypothetical protein